MLLLVFQNSKVASKRLICTTAAATKSKTENKSATTDDVAAKLPKTDRECLASHSSYSSASELSRSATYTTDYYPQLVYTSHPSVSISTWCDGVARKVARQYSGYATVYSSTQPYETFSTPAGPSPTCTIEDTRCGPLLESYSSAQSTEYPPIPSPPCTPFTSCTSNTAGPCSLTATNVKIYYWPTPASKPLCSSSGTSASPAGITAAPDARHKVVSVVDGIIMTSPSIYVSMSGVFGRVANQMTWYLYPCGSTVYDVVLSLTPPPTTVTRAFGGPHPLLTNTKLFELSTLNWPVTITLSCDTIRSPPFCAPLTIDPFNYQPILLLPTDLVDKAAKKYKPYASCVVSQYHGT
jgi:hypothetical protein